MNAQRGARLALGICLLLSLIFIPRVANAACNLIPVAKVGMPSTTAAVATPIAAPGTTIDLLVRDCETSAGFEPNPLDNDITITFLPPVGPPTDVAVDSITAAVSDCTPGGRCGLLQFPMPDTTALVPPYGLAGPARIVVRDSTSAVVAQIDALHLTTSGCDRFPDRIFEHFTVLPAPNNVADLRDGVATEMLATSDGSGSLLIPFDYWGGGVSSVLAETPGSPIARFIEGAASIPAQGAGDPQTIFEVLAAQPSPSDFVRAFTLDGRPLPPLLRVTQVPSILATADAEYSVLRIAINDGQGGPDLFDLTDRYAGDVGPVVIDTFSVTQREPIPLAGLRASDQSIAYSRSEAREVADLNLDGDMDDYVVQIVDALSGDPTDTQSAIAIASNNTASLVSELPITIDAEGDLIAFLESEFDQDVDRTLDGDKMDLLLRVFDRDGTDLTAAVPATEREAAVELAVANKSVKISGDRVFFRSPGAAIQIVDNGVDGVMDLVDARTLVISPDDKHIYASTSFGNVVVFSRDASSGLLSYVETVAADVSNQTRDSIALSPDGKHLYVRGVVPVLTRVLNVFSRDAVTGELTFIERLVQGVGGVDGLRVDGPVIVSPDGDHVYVAGEVASSPGETAVSTFDRDAVSGELTYSSSVVNDGGGLTELDDIRDMDFDASGTHLYVTGFSRVVFERDGVTGTLTPVQQTSYNLLPILGNAIEVSPHGRFVYEVTFDPALDPGALFFTWLTTYDRDAVTGAITANPVRQEITSNSSGLRALAVDPSGSRIYVTAEWPGEGLQVFEVDPAGGVRRAPNTVFTASGIRRTVVNAPIVVTSDGGQLIVAVDASIGGTTNAALASLRTTTELAVFDAASSSIRPTRALGHHAEVTAQRALVWTQESLLGADLNGDTDQNDIVTRLFDVSTTADSLFSLGVAVTDASISDQVVAVAVPEYGQNQTVLNGDGDTDDNVLAVHTIGGAPTATNLGVAAEKVLAVGAYVVFTRPEAAEPLDAIHCVDSGGGTCDLNGDGDSDDRVLHYYRGSDGAIVNTGLASISPWPISFFAGEADDQDFLADGSLVALVVGETEQGQNLNGDLDTTDDVLHVLDLATGEVKSTATAMQPCIFMVCEPSRHYRVDAKRQTVSFIVFEFEDGNDLDLDGDANDILLVIYNLLSGERQLVKLYNDTELLGDRPFTPALPDELFLSGFTIQQVRESDVGADLNGDGLVSDDFAVVLGVDADDDGVLDRFDTCVETANPDELDQDGDLLGDSRCDPSPALCPSTPRVGCRQAALGKSKLLVKDKEDDTKDQLKWKWAKGDATVLADFGDPVVGLAQYSVCVYDDSGALQPRQKAAVLPGGECAGKPCWKAAGTKGYRYKDKQGFPNDLQLVKLKAGEQGKAQVQAKGKGELLALPTLPLTLPVTVQLAAREGTTEVCWETVYTTALKHDATILKATGP